MIPATMWACRVFAYGDPSVLKMVEVPVPSPGPDEVLLQVRSTAVARHDVARRRGELTGLNGQPFPLPFQPGQNAAGVVVSVGERVREIGPGDHVATMSAPACGNCWYCRRGEDAFCVNQERPSRNTQGTYADYMTCRASEPLVAPKHIPFAKLANCVWPYSTAWNMAVHHAAIEPGFSVLVTGASGSIGLAAMQIARLRGASQIIAVSNSRDKAPRLLEHGADAVIDGRSDDVPQAARRLTGGRGVDLVLDCVGGDLFVAGLRALRNCGRLLNIAQLAGEQVSFNLRELFPRGISIHGTRGSTRAAQEDVLRLLADGRIDPVIHAVLPLSQAADGHRLFEAQAHVGRIILTPEHA
jgi:NADPH:quinone reductase-like Zn-dependent oxidoreductase